MNFLICNYFILIINLILLKNINILVIIKISYTQVLKINNNAKRNL